jgi:hypothetical protein
MCGKIKQDSDGNYYKYDRLHGEVEKFNSRGDHLGALDPISGKKIKDAVPGRNIRSELK